MAKRNMSVYASDACCTRNVALGDALEVAINEYLKNHAVEIEKVESRAAELRKELGL